MLALVTNAEVIAIHVLRQFSTNLQENVSDHFCMSRLEFRVRKSVCRFARKRLDANGSHTIKASRPAFSWPNATSWTRPARTASQESRGATAKTALLARTS